MYRHIYKVYEMFVVNKNKKRMLLTKKREIIHLYEWVCEWCVLIELNEREERRNVKGE